MDLGHGASLLVAERDADPEESPWLGKMQRNQANLLWECKPRGSEAVLSYGRTQVEVVV